MLEVVSKFVLEVVTRHLVSIGVVALILARFYPDCVIVMVNSVVAPVPIAAGQIQLVPLTAMMVIFFYIHITRTMSDISPIVIKYAPVNLYYCGSGSTFQCGTGQGPGNCSTNFTLEDQDILLRDDQQPGKPNALNYSNPSTPTFVDKASIPSATVTVTSSSSNRAPSAMVVGLGVGLPLGVLLLAALGVIYFQQRRLQQSAKENPKISAEDLARAVGPQTQNRRVGELPASWPGTEAGSREIHEMQSPDSSLQPTNMI